MKGPTVLPLEGLTLEEVGHVVRILKQSSGRSTRRRTEHSCQQPALTDQLGEIHRPSASLQMTEAS